MGKSIKPIIALKDNFLRLQLVDQCLLIIMSTLFIQIILTLFFFHESIYQNEIDVVVRTTASAIFGYFLSSNFMSSVGPKMKCTIDEKSTQNKNSHTNNQQVIIVFIIGLVSLILLIITRNCFGISEHIRGTISQLRDFVSGSVGFLVGSPIKKENQITK